MPRPGSNDLIATSRFVTAPDGLKLHVRIYGAPTAAVPVVCLPGLTRTSEDFAVVATALASDAARPRQIFAIDSRGRGLSDYDPDPSHYNVGVELADVMAILDALVLRPAVFIGTSRGGILTMLLASVRPAALAGAVLNDIGPVIDLPGLLRIKGYVGKLSNPASRKEAADILRGLFQAQFPKLTAEDWLAFAGRSFREQGGEFVPTYDVRLAQTLEAITPDIGLAPLWKEFDALARVPVMVIRGANSDLLSDATLAAMRARRPDMETLVVPDQGHAPLLMDDETVERIARFVARCDLPPFVSGKEKTPAGKPPGS